MSNAHMRMPALHHVRQGAEPRTGHARQNNGPFFFLRQHAHTLQGLDMSTSPVKSRKRVGALVVRCEGLTLIEVMLALAIVAVGLTTIIAALSRCLSVIAQSRAYETSRHLLTRVEVEEPLLLKEKIEPGTESGSFSGNYYGYRWTREVELVGRKEDGLFRIRTRVYWTERGQENFDEVMTYLYAPEEVEGGSFQR